MVRTKEDRDQAIKELMISIRKNTQPSKCIDVFENLLNEISDKDVVDTAITDMSRFAGEFSRLCHDVDNMKSVDFIAKVLTYDFLQVNRYFISSKKNAMMYLQLNDVLKKTYHPYIYKEQKDIVLSNKNILGTISHRDTFSEYEMLKLTKKFGVLIDLTNEKVREKLELSRQVVLLYNYMPAVVKAFFQTKRRTFDLDKNSKKFE